MVFVQNTKIKDPKPTPFQIEKFNGGLNNVSSPFNLKGNESPDLLNVFIHQDGMVESRPGLFKYALDLIPETIYQIFLYETDTIKCLLLSGKTKLYRLNIGEENYTEICNVNNTISGYQYGNKFFFVDGDKYREYNGTNIYEIIPPIGTEPKGEITYDETNKTVTYNPLDAETTDPYLGGNNIAMVAKTKLSVQHKQKVYFTIDNLRNLIYTSDFDNPYYIPINAFLPPVTHDGDYIVGMKSFNDVLVIFKKNTVFALYGNDETDYDLKEVAVVTGAVNNNVVQQFGNYLIYLGNDGKIYSLYDVRTDIKKMMAKSISDSLDLVKTPLNIEITNMEDAHAIVYDGFYILKVQDKILVFNDGWMIWDNINPTTFFAYDNKLLTTNANRKLYHIPFKRFEITETFVAEAEQEIFNLEKGYINEISSDVELKIDGVINTSIVKLSNSSLKITPCTGGEVISIKYLSLQCYNDDGDGYFSKWHSKDLDFNHPNRSKQFRKIWITAHTYKYFASNITFKALVDYYEVGSGVTISNQITLWGVSKFGHRFIDRNVVASEPITVAKRGKVVRFIVENNEYDQPFKLFRISGDVIIKSR